MPERIPALDLAWLRMTAPESPLLGAWLMELEGPVSGAELQELLRALWGLPRFRAHPERLEGGWCWVQSPGPPEALLLEHTLEDEGALEEALGGWLSVPLDPGGPQWRLHAVRLPTRSVLVWVVHHALCDGLALSRVFRELLGDGGSELVPVRAPPSLRWSQLPAALWSLGTVPAAPPLPWVGSLGTRKRFARAPALPVAALRARAKAEGCGLGDLLLALAAGALRRDLLARGLPLHGLRPHAALPVNLRGEEALPALGNGFGVLYLQLPVAVAEPRERLGRIVAERRLPHRPTAARLGLGVLELMGRLPPSGQRALEWMTGSKTAVILSVIPDTCGPLRVAGRRVVGMCAWAPPSSGVALTLTLLTSGEGVHLAVAADEACRSEPGELLRAFVQEAADWGLQPSSEGPGSR